MHLLIVFMNVKTQIHNLNSSNSRSIPRKQLESGGWKEIRNTKQNKYVFFVLNINVYKREMYSLLL